MPQETALYDDLSARENVAFFARLHGVTDPRTVAESVLRDLDLADRFTSATYTLSGGMQKRVSLAAALVHDPELLILDEPTAALDPLLKRNLWKRFREMATQRKTLIISTHLIDEAMLCDSVVLLQHGHVVAHGSPDSLISQGNVKLTYHEEGTERSETVTADSAAIAKALHAHGLSLKVTGLDIQAENLEDVMVSLLDKKEQK